jgi:hypothetical protein
MGDAMTLMDERSERAGTVRMGGVAPSSGGEKMTMSEAGRLVALEFENLRLTRLVAELLMKNQQLRER